MFSRILSIKPNPNYVPGGVENFWLTASSTPKKDGGKSGESFKPVSGFASCSSSESGEVRKKAGDKNAFIPAEEESSGWEGFRRTLFA